MRPHAFSGYGRTTVDLESRGGGAGRGRACHERNLNYDFAEQRRDEFKILLADLTHDGALVVLLDLSEVGAIDSCGVGLVISALNAASAHGVEMGMIGVAPFLERVLEVMRLRRHLHIFGTEADAIEALLRKT